MLKLKHENIKKILIIRLSSIGDIILTTQTIRLLRKLYPNATIDYVIQKELSELIEYNPRITNIIKYDKKLSLAENNKERDKYLKGEKYDLVVDLHNNLRSRFYRKGIFKHLLKLKKYRIEKFAMVHFHNSFNQMPHVTERYYNVISELGIERDNKGLEVWLENEHAYKSNEKSEKTNIIGIAPGAKHFTKMFPNEKLILLFKDLLLIYPDFKFKIFGIASDKPIATELKAIGGDKVEDFCGKYTLLETAREIDTCDALITNDSGLMHLAAARKVNTLVLFGSTIPQFGFTPFGNKSEIVEIDLDCRPCTHIGRDKCPKGHFNCMNLITNKMILDKLEKLL